MCYVIIRDAQRCFWSGICSYVVSYLPLVGLEHSKFTRHIKVVTILHNRTYLDDIYVYCWLIHTFGSDLIYDLEQPRY